MIYEKFNRFSRSCKVESVQNNTVLAITGTESNFQREVYQEPAFKYLKDKRWLKRLCYYNKILSTNPANIPLDEDVFMTSFVFVFRRRFKDVFKTFWSRRTYWFYSHVFRRRLQDFFKTSWSRPIYSSWSYILKTSSRRLKDVLPRRLQDVLQKRLQDIFKTSCKHVFETLSRRVIKLRCFIMKLYSSYSYTQVLVFHFTTPFSGCSQRII